jgi:1-acyl-sn-glycerol-3-phosphate acyltransferase
VVYRLLRPIVLLFHPIEVKGLENLPDEPVVLCANHSSAWDPVLLICALRGDFPLRIMAKKQLFSIPLLAPLLRKMGAFPVDRGNSDINAVKNAIRSLKDGWNLLVFPEGTRVKKPGENPPKGGVAMIAIRSGVALLPVFVGTTKKLFHRTSIVLGRPYTPVYTGRKGTAEEYQANAEKIMEQVYELGGVK